LKLPAPIAAADVLTRRGYSRNRFARFGVA
jgi:hypothetical protein